MKKILGLMLVAVAFSSQAAFVHTLDFNNSAEQQKVVLDYIKEKVTHEYCDGPVDLCQPTTLRMMEKENLRSFKELTKATNRPMLDQMIENYCHSSIDMCNYITINLMYKENLKASDEELSW